MKGHLEYDVAQPYQRTARTSVQYGSHAQEGAVYGRSQTPCMEPSDRLAVSAELSPRVTAGLVICAIGSGCSAAVDRVAIEDAQTAARVKTALVNDPELGASAIEVRAEYGIVQLAGRVRTQIEADRAAAVARSVPGVQGIELALQVGVEAPAELPDARAPSRAAPTDNVPEIEGDPDLLAVGVSVGLSHPRSPALETRVAISPVIKLGSGEGLGVAVGFDWFQAEVQLATSGPAAMTRIHVKPIMVGLSYTLDSESCVPLAVDRRRLRLQQSQRD